MTKKISFWDIFYSIAPWRLKFLKAFDCLAGGAMAFLLPKLPGDELPKKIKKILIVRPGGIGDAVFLLPVLKALKHQGFIIDVLCERRNAGVFTAQAFLLNAIYLYDQRPFAVFANSYDAIFDTEQWHYLSALTAYFVRSTYKIGFATRPLRAKLFHKPVEYGIGEYELDNFERLFKDILNAPPLKLGGSFDVDAPSQDWAKEQIGGKFIAFFLGASIALRRFNEGQTMAIVSHYLGMDYSIALLGGKDVESFVQGIAAKLYSLPLVATYRSTRHDSGRDREGFPKIFNYAGKLSLIHSAALIQRSSLFIGPDSGLMHLACAIDVPVVGIFGPGNLAKWGPKGEKHKVITENVSCSPCTRFGYTVPTCHGSYHCMKDIKVEKIWNG